MIRVRGNTSLTLITGDSLDLSIKANCLDVIEKVLFICPDLGICEELPLMNYLFTLHIPAEDTGSYKEGSHKYSCKMYLRSGGVKTVIFDGLLGVSKGHVVPDARCPFDYADSTDETFVPVPNLFIDLLDVINVLPLSYMKVELGIVGTFTYESDSQYTFTAQFSQEDLAQLVEYSQYTGAKSLGLTIIDSANHNPSSYRLEYVDYDPLDNIITGWDLTNSCSISLYVDDQGAVEGTVKFMLKEFSDYFIFNTEEYALVIQDENGNAVFWVDNDGNLRTKNFNSAAIAFPPITPADEGKFAMVNSEGEWVAAEVPQAAGQSF